MKEIQYALESRLLQTPDINPAAVAWANLDFQPNLAAHGYFVRPTYIPAEPDVASLGATGFMRHTGIFQIDIFTPRGQSTYVANEWASKIVDHFPVGLVLTADTLNIRITRSAQVGAGIAEPDIFMLPVLVRFMTYKQF